MMEDDEFGDLYAGVDDDDDHDFVSSKHNSMSSSSNSSSSESECGSETEDDDDLQILVNDETTNDVANEDVTQDYLPSKDIKETLPWRHNGYYDFTLPPSKTIFDVDLDKFEGKRWRLPGVDLSDFFNYDLDEESWKLYYWQMEKHRVGKNKQNPSIEKQPWQLGQDFVSTMPRASRENISYKQDSTISNGNAVSPSPAKPTGLPIRVEAGRDERLPSVDVRRPRNRDSDVIIKINVHGTGMDGPATSEGISKKYSGDMIETKPEVSQCYAKCGHTFHDCQTSCHVEVTDSLCSIVENKFNNLHSRTVSESLSAPSPSERKSCPCMLLDPKCGIRNANSLIDDSHLHLEDQRSDGSMATREELSELEDKTMSDEQHIPAREDAKLNQVWSAKKTNDGGYNCSNDSIDPDDDYQDTLYPYQKAAKHKKHDVFTEATEECKFQVSMLDGMYSKVQFASTKLSFEHPVNGTRDRYSCRLEKHARSLSRRNRADVNGSNFPGYKSLLNMKYCDANGNSISGSYRNSHHFPSERDMAYIERNRDPFDTVKESRRMGGRNRRHDDSNDKDRKVGIYLQTRALADGETGRIGNYHHSKYRNRQEDVKSTRLEHLSHEKSFPDYKITDKDRVDKEEDFHRSRADNYRKNDLNNSRYSRRKERIDKSKRTGDGYYSQESRHEIASSKGYIVQEKILMSEWRREDAFESRHAIDKTENINGSQYYKQYFRGHKNYREGYGRNGFFHNHCVNGISPQNKLSEDRKRSSRDSKAECHISDDREKVMHKEGQYMDTGHATDAPGSSCCSLMSGLGLTNVKVRRKLLDHHSLPQNEKGCTCGVQELSSELSHAVRSEIHSLPAFTEKTDEKLGANSLSSEAHKSSEEATLNGDKSNLCAAEMDVRGSKSVPLVLISEKEQFTIEKAEEPSVHNDNYEAEEGEFLCEKQVVETNSVVASDGIKMKDSDENILTPYLLEALAKLEKRKERFKRPLVAEKQTNTPNNTCETLPEDPISEVKLQRPARKRKWTKDYY